MAWDCTFFQATTPRPSTIAGGLHPLRNIIMTMYDHLHVLVISMKDEARSGIITGLVAGRRRRGLTTGDGSRIRARCSAKVDESQNVGGHGVGEAGDAQMTRKMVW